MEIIYLMSKTYTIGSLSKISNTPVSTLRYYERVGLLVPQHRSAKNYRLYGSSDFKRLRFIKAAKGSGFTLDDIRAILILENGEANVCKEVKELIRCRLEDVVKQIEDLRHVQKVLRSSFKLCQSSLDDDHCEVIEHLIEKRT